MTPHQSYIIKGRTRIAYFSFAFFAVPGLLSLATGKFNKGLLFISAAWFVLSAVIYIFCRTTKIYIDDQGFTYHSPYGKKFSIRWAEITLSTLELTPQGLQTIVLHWKFETFAGKEHAIELGYFSRNDMRLFAEKIIDKTKGAVLSPTIYRMGKGKFPWYIF